MIMVKVKQPTHMADWNIKCINHPTNRFVFFSSDLFEKTMQGKIGEIKNDQMMLSLTMHLHRWMNIALFIIMNLHTTVDLHRLYGVRDENHRKYNDHCI
mmetsp:Transcript_31096/g.47630  ORF Transcript_31096/g.47630 Transcript_31096/m.47630 type:complete len:99 (+) Transcript_31096:223-519(+)